VACQSCHIPDFARVNPTKMSWDWAQSGKLKDGKKFIEIAKKVNKIKPIVVLKAGKTDSGKKAVSTHTGSLAGNYEIYKAAFKQTGIFIAETIEGLFDIAKVLANQPPCKQNAVAVVTNAGGCGVLMVDYCSIFNINLVELKKDTIKKLDSTKKMSPVYSRRNPLDIIGDALPETYEAAINTLLGENYIHGLIVIQTIQTMTNPEADAEIIINAHKQHPEKPILSVYMGGRSSKRGRIMLEKNNIPDFNDLKKVAIAMKALIDRGKIN